MKRSMTPTKKMGMMVKSEDENDDDNDDEK